jgi:hypothetical protein
MINLRAFLDHLIQRPRFLDRFVQPRPLRALMHLPKNARSQAPGNIKAILAITLDIDAIAFSIGLGNTISGFVDR